MTFTEALNLMVTQNAGVRRAHWNKGDYCYSIHDGLYYKPSCLPGWKMYSITVKDIMATDWEEENLSI